MGPVDWLSLVDAFVLGGVAVVLPLAIPWRGWAPAAAGVLIALLLPRGWLAVLFVVPWLVLGSLRTAMVIAAERRQLLGLSDEHLVGATEAVAAAYSVVAAVAFAHSRLGADLLGVHEPIVELTAVHFVYAGTAALTLARFTLQAHAGPVARLGVVLTGLAPPVVATGFVTGREVAQVGGAVMMAGGVWCTGALHLLEAWRRSSPRLVRLLLAVSGSAIWVPMVLAVAWAAAQHRDVPALSVPDMVRVHGVLNALGFTLCGLVARNVARVGRGAARPAELLA